MNTQIPRHTPRAEIDLTLQKGDRVKCTWQSPTGEILETREILDGPTRESISGLVYFKTGPRDKSLYWTCRPDSYEPLKLLSLKLDTRAVDLGVGSVIEFGGQTYLKSRSESPQWDRVTDTHLTLIERLSSALSDEDIEPMIASTARILKQ